MQTEQVSLVIFTCEGREHLLLNTLQSFYKQCAFKFDKIILAIDGQIDPKVIATVNPDAIIQHYQRHGYVHSIAKCLKVIDTAYFFWLEDDWTFNRPVDVPALLADLKKNDDWAEIVYSKFGPLSDDFKVHPLRNNLYKTTFGFSANPSLCNTKHLQSAFSLLTIAQKGDKLGEDGFENFLSKTFDKQNIKCVIIDPIDHLPISHEGFLESTPRKWHMTNSLESKPTAHLLYIPKPSVYRRIKMIIKLFIALLTLSIKQLFNNKAYELCFRIIAQAKRLKNGE
jgi:hypothetical protein